MLPITSTREEILEWLRTAYENRTAVPNGSSTEYRYSTDYPVNFDLFVQKVGTGFEDCLWAVEQLATFLVPPKRSQRLQTFVWIAMKQPLTIEQMEKLLPYAGKKCAAVMLENLLAVAETDDTIGKAELIRLFRKYYEET